MVIAVKDRIIEHEGMYFNHTAIRRDMKWILLALEKFEVNSIIYLIIIADLQF